jgi:hypothetical protein
MERNGLFVLRTGSSVDEVRRSLTQVDWFSAITFHNDFFPPEDAAVATARELSPTPLILFQNPAVGCGDEPFDLVIPVPTPPEAWWGSFEQIIEESRRLCERSRQLQQECADQLGVSRALREASMRNRVNPIDYDVLFRGKPDKEPE